MRLAFIADLLAENCPDLAGRVGAALSGSPPRGYPYALVLPLAERVVDGVLSGSVRVFEAAFAVDIYHKNAADAATGAGAVADLDVLREQVLAALVGRDLGDGFGVVEFSGGQLEDYQPGLALWRDRFSVRFVRE